MKPKVLIVGGMTHNIPHQLHDHFDVVKQLPQDQKKVSGNLPVADHIIVIRNWVHHGLINSVRIQFPNHPFIWVNKGWRCMMDELKRRGLIHVAKEVAVIEDPEAIEDPKDTTPDPLEGMSDEELDRLTKPEAPTPQDVFVPLGPTDSLWLERFHLWAITWSERTGIPTDKIKRAFVSKDGEHRLPALLSAIPELDRDVAKKVLIGFHKTRSLFDKDPTAPVKPLIPRGGSPFYKSKKGEGPSPALPPVLNDDITAMLRGSQKLVEKRNALLAQIETLKDEIVKVDKEFELIKPLLLAVENMKKAAAQIRSAAGQKVLT